ncbi:MAG: hypothetical protein HYW02_04315, partial [Deltaproteobacteria bacterium]|nr:hypothetical protein [Deltaproteobacteria bacterium]
MKRSVDLMFLMVVISCIGFGLVGCGDTETSASGAATETGSGSGTLSLEAQVSVASTSSFSLPGLVVKNVTESTASNKTVTCQDLTGATIGTCTTDSSGECTITGITEDQVKAGVVLVAATDTVLLHSYRQYTAEEIAATPAGTSLEAVPVNSEEDMAYAVAQTACSGNLASCDTVDRDCVVEATTAMATGGSPSESDMKGYVEAMLEAHKVAISNAPAGTSPADLLKKGLDGDPAAYTGVAGTRTPTGSVPISDAVQNFDAMMDKITTAYCAKTDAATKSVWQQVREDAKTGQETFQPKAVIGIFEGFKPSELGEYEIEDFRGFAQALPQLDNGFDMFANHEKARLAARNMFREGAFTDPSKAPVALGVVAST